MKKEFNYELDVQIDENSLDIECLRQPELMLKYGNYEAEMDKEKSKMEEKLDILKADLDIDIRKHPENYGLKDVKITETVITNTIINQKDFQELWNKLLDIKEEYFSAKNAVKAFNQKKEMLEGLIKLHGQQYFAGPSVPRDLSTEKKKKTKQQEDVNAQIGNSFKRRRKS